MKTFLWTQFVKEALFYTIFSPCWLFCQCESQMIGLSCSDHSKSPSFVLGWSIKVSESGWLSAFSSTAGADWKQQPLSQQHHSVCLQVSWCLLRKRGGWGGREGGSLRDSKADWVRDWDAHDLDEGWSRRGGKLQKGGWFFGKDISCDEAVMQNEPRFSDIRCRLSLLKTRAVVYLNVEHTCCFRLFVINIYDIHRSL